MDNKTARRRNVLIKITKAHIKEGFNLNNSYDREGFKQKLYLKVPDLENYKDDIFTVEHDSYKLNESTINKIETYEDKYNEIRKKFDIGDKEEFIKNFEYMKRNTLTSFSDKDMKSAFYSAHKLAIKLHWYYMPIYDEYMIVNRECIPEDNPSEYYNHYHALEDLYLAIVSNKYDESYKEITGDVNLNKEFPIEIYSSRWGHMDKYLIKRTSKGWYSSVLSFNGESDKNGKSLTNPNENGYFFEALEHDSIFYPKDAVEYALGILWDEADNSNMSLDDLKYKFNEIANWINSVERASKYTQPDWCGYY